MFTSLRLDHFLSHVHTEVALADRGLVLIEGEFRGKAYATSNGAGKSAFLPDGLVFPLWGRTFRGLRGDEVVHDQFGRDCYTEVTLRAPDGSHARVIRTAKHRDPKLQRPQVIHGANTYLGDSEVSRVVDLLLGGMSFETFAAACVFRKVGFFTQMTDAARKDCLEELAGLTVLSRACDGAKARAKLGTDAVTKAQMQLGLAEERSTVAGAYHEMIRKQWEEQETERKAKQARLNDDLAVVEKKLQTSAKAHAQLIQERGAAVLASSKASTAIRELQDAQAQGGPALLDTTRRLDELTMQINLRRTDLLKVERLPDVCPTCERPIPPESKLSRTEMLRDEISGLLEERQVVEAMARPAQELAKLLEMRCSEAQTTLAECLTTEADLARRANALETERQVLSSTAAQLRERLLEIAQPMSAELVDQAAADSRRAEQAEAHAAKALQAAEEDWAYITSWVKWYGPTGIKARLLADVIPQLNARAPRYSQLLTDGEIGVTFKSTTELKSGETRDKFDVACWVNEAGSTYKKMSDGQRRRADLIATMALADHAAARLAAPINLVILDEPFEGLDAAGMEYAVAMLHALVEARGSVFCMTHQAGLSQWFPATFRVSFERGISTLCELG